MKYNGKDLIVLREQSLKLIISFTRIVSHKVIFYFFLQGSRKCFWSTYWMHFSQIKVWRLSFFVIIIRGHGAETVKSGRLYLFSDDTSYNWHQNWKIEWEWRQCDRITFCEIWVSFLCNKKTGLSKHLLRSSGGVEFFHGQKILLAFVWFVFV